MKFGAYFDDSGHPNNDESVTVAGFVATEEQWLLFETEWKAAISVRPYDLTVFHMTDFESDPNIARADKDRLLWKLVAIIRTRVRFHFSQSVLMADYRETNEHMAFEESIGAPYALAGRTVAKDLREWREKYGGNDCKLLVAFENGTKHKGDFIARMEADGLPCPMFVTKNEAVPLQAADLAGWEVSWALKHLRLRSHYEWLIDRVPFNAGVYKREDLEKLCYHQPRAVLPRPEADDAFIAYHSTPRRRRKRTIF